MARLIPRTSEVFFALMLIVCGALGLMVVTRIGLANGSAPEARQGDAIRAAATGEAAPGGTGSGETLSPAFGDAQAPKGSSLR